MSNYLIDFKSQQLTFLDSRFYTTPSGGFVPSVTTILEAYPKTYSYYQWLKEVGKDADAIRNAAGDRGSIVHKLTERYDAGIYKVMNIKEVADYLGVHTSTIYKHAQRGTIPAFKVGSDWRFSQKHINQWIDDQMNRKKNKR